MYRMEWKKRIAGITPKPTFVKREQIKNKDLIIHYYETDLRNEIIWISVFDFLNLLNLFFHCILRSFIVFFNNSLFAFLFAFLFGFLFGFLFTFNFAFLLAIVFFLFFNHRLVRFFNFFLDLFDLILFFGFLNHFFLTLSFLFSRAILDLHDFCNKKTIHVMNI